MRAYMSYTLRRPPPPKKQKHFFFVLFGVAARVQVCFAPARKVHKAFFFGFFVLFLFRRTASHLKILPKMIARERPLCAQPKCVDRHMCGENFKIFFDEQTFMCIHHTHTHTRKCRLSYIVRHMCYLLTYVAFV